MIAPLSDHPVAWLIATVNVASFLIAGLGAIYIAVRFRRWHWLAITLAVLMTVVPAIEDSASSGMIPYAPHEEAVSIPPGSGAVRVTKTFTPWSYLSTAVALLVVVAIRDEKRRANQSTLPTPV